MKKAGLVVFASIALATLSMANAGPGAAAAGDTASMSSWEKIALYEPCMNGDVSASGSYPSQSAEDKSFATLGILAQ